MSHWSERRKNPRVPFSAQVTAYAGNDQLPCTALNISMSGIALSAPFARTAGEFVRVQCTVDGVAWLDADAVVVHCRHATGGWQWGVAFLRVSPTSSESIRQYVDAQIARAHSTQPPRPRSMTPSVPNSSPTSSPRPVSSPAPISGSRPPIRPVSQPRVQPPAVSRHELAEIYREALEDINRTNKKR